MSDARRRKTGGQPCVHRLDKDLTIRLSEGEKELIALLADQAGLSMGRYIVLACRALGREQIQPLQDLAQQLRERARHDLLQAKRRRRNPEACRRKALQPFRAPFLRRADAQSFERVVSYVAERMRHGGPSEVRRRSSRDFRRALRSSCMCSSARCIRRRTKPCELTDDAAGSARPCYRARWKRSGSGSKLRTVRSWKAWRAGGSPARRPRHVVPKGARTRLRATIARDGIERGQGLLRLPPPAFIRLPARRIDRGRGPSSIDWPSRDDSELDRRALGLACPILPGSPPATEAPPWRST